MDPGGLTSLSDEALVSRLAVGQIEPLAELVRRHQGRLHAISLRTTASPADAEDLVQETWLRVARKAHTFDPSRSFVSWLASIAANLAIDWSRAAPVRRAASGSDSENPQVEGQSVSHGPDFLLESKRAHRKLARAVEALPERLRAVVLLRYFEELSEQEAAERLGVPKGTVKSRLHHALRHLDGALRPQEDGNAA